MATSAIDSILQNAYENGIIPGAVVLAATKDKGVVYSKSLGLRSFEKGSKSEPLQIDDIMGLYSASKLITGIAALQISERGLVDLDEDVAKILPELACLKVLTGMDDHGKPIMEERSAKITLRQLISHSGGVTYDFLTPLLMRYNESQGLDPIRAWTTTVESFSCPLVAQPGTAWKYGTGFEWAGYLVSHLTGMSLEEYTKQNIAAPLGIDDMTYFPRKNESLRSRMVSVTRRDPNVEDGKGKVILDTHPDILGAVQEELGGVGLYTSMNSYMKVLCSLLADDEKLLKKETTAKMFQPQLTPAAQRSLQSNFDHIAKGEEVGVPPYVGTFPQVRYDFGLGGMLSMEDIDSGSLKWRRKGYFFWSGMPNIFWFVDRAAGVCAIFGTQVMPNADEQIRKVINMVEKEVYAKFALQA
ncbi:hypothetical protein UA08_02307 [Talaromyces atroroseus]|uniref:Beta-lactamase-related domain-containing protein n=1 Tax=Talaromyces atroroseus TaxID=1441469 RepID=A0A225AL45_TALAT|nr:hypothetical protein UA08_02307 [Talaromyces atroroseus]OKL62291.1 hypothetical protein UA08_02307 [Talaromyces atroroseus]